MWLGAFLSVVLTLVCAVATPIIATVGVPRGLLVAITVVGIVSAVLLAGFGAITAVVIMLRLQAGQFFLPAGLRLPLPAGMRPELSAPTASEYGDYAPI